MALDGMKDTMERDALAPNLLYFESLPTLLIIASDMPTQRARMAAIRTAREEMVTLVTAQSISRPFSSKLPPTTRHTITPGDRVGVYRDRRKAWKSPVVVRRTSGKQWVAESSGNLKQFKLPQLLPEATESDDRTQCLHHSGICGPDDAIHPPHCTDGIDATGISDTSKNQPLLATWGFLSAQVVEDTAADYSQRKCVRYDGDPLRTANTSSGKLTARLHPADLRGRSDILDRANSDELEGLQNGGIFSSCAMRSCRGSRNIFRAILLGDKGYGY